MTYDQTSRKKILAHAQTFGVRATLRKFDVSRHAYYTWIKQAQADYVKPPRKPFYTKLNPQELKAFVLEHPNWTTAQIGAHFQVHAETVRTALHKLGFSFKKRSFCMSSETKKNGQNTKKG